MSILKPPRLRKHDVIGVIAPASAPSSTVKIEKGIRYLEQLGYRIKLGKYVKETHGYLAGRDIERATDFNAMFADKKVRAIFTVRGGYGTPRLLNQIDYALIRRNPKILVGYSDITAIQLAIYKKAGLITFSGPMLAVEMMDRMDTFTEEFFWMLLTSPQPLGMVLNPDLRPLQLFNSPLKKSPVTGRLLGGNLSMILSLLATPFQPNFSKQILFFEEIGEEPYRIDRMLMQLKLAGVLRAVKALLVGSFTDCVPSDRRKPNLTIDEILKEVTQDLPIPIFRNLAYGHVSRKLTLPIGLTGKVNPRLDTLVFTESAVV